MKKNCLLLSILALSACSAPVSSSTRTLDESANNHEETSSTSIGSFSFGLSSLENSSQEQIIDSSNGTINTGSASVSDPKVEDAFSIIRFIKEKELEDSFVDTNQYGFTYDTSESSNIAINENDRLVMGTNEAGGLLAFNVNSVLSKVVLNIVSAAANDNVKIGYINKSGIKIFYDTIQDANTVSSQFSEKNNPTHIIIKTSTRLEISSILLYKK